MQLVERHIINRSHEAFIECDKVCLLSKKLYNRANYIIRQEFIKTSKEKQDGNREYAIYLNYFDIRRILLEDSDYISLPRKVSNQTLMLLDKNWKSFFAATREYKKNPLKFLGRPKLPEYLNIESGRFVTIYEKGAVSMKSLKKGFIGLSGVNIEIPTKQTRNNICQVRIIPRTNSFVVEVVYEKQEKKSVKGNVIASIDPGVNNLATVAFNKPELDSFIINGRPLKSINQFYNKKRAEMQSKLEKELNKKTSKNLNRLSCKRNEKIRDYMHKASKTLVNQLAESQTGTLVIGKSVGQKQRTSMSKSNNQNFDGIPLFRFLDMVAYKARLEGIDVVWQEESYTSKASFLSGDHIPTYGNGKEGKHTFSGYREHRGLYKIKGENTKINADLNGALNILKKAVPNAFVDGIEGIAVCPRRMNISV